MSPEHATTWRRAREVWPKRVSFDPELEGAQLAEQMTIARGFVADHLAKSEAASVCLSSLKVAAEAVAGDWVSQTACLAALLESGYEIEKGRRGAIFVRACPRNLWLLRALRRGKFPTHHELEAARGRR